MVDVAKVNMFGMGLLDLSMTIVLLAMAWSHLR